jgi:hypothetical protein
MTSYHKQVGWWQPFGCHHRSFNNNSNYLLAK